MKSEQARPLSFGENIDLVWGFRSYFARYLPIAFGLLLLALLEADLAATAARASGVLIGRFAATSTVAASAASAQQTSAAVERGFLPASYVFGTIVGRASIAWIALTMAGFLLLAMVLRIGAEQLRGRVNQRFRHNIQKHLVAALAREAGETRSRRSPGNATQIFLADAAGLSSVLIFGVVGAAQSLVMIALYVSRLWQLPNGWIVAVALFPVLVLFQVGVARLFLEREVRATEQSEGLNVRVRTRAAEFFDVLGRLAYFKGEAGEAEKLLAMSYGSADSGRRLQFISSIANSISEIGTSLSFPLVVIVLSVPALLAMLAPRAITSGAVTAESLMEMQGVFLLLTASSGAVIAIPGLLAQFSPTLRRIREVLDIPSPGPRPAELEFLRRSTHAPHIVIEGLSFGYADAPTPVLRDIDLELPPGARVGLVGPSGCGKSTLARLLLGDQRPTSGRIFFDGVDVAPWHFWWRRELVGYLPAEQGFLRGTLEENILFGRSRDAVRDIESALRASGVAEIVDQRRAEGGLQFRIDGRVEDVLSTGQRRKVGIARLLVGDHRLWIFDEPGSGLDAHSMRDVALGLAESTAGRTCVIITHDPDVFVTDFNVFLQDGRVADIGSHELLLARNAAYASLVTRFTREREEERSATEQGVAAKDAVLPGTRPAPPVTLNADFPQKVRLQ